MKGYSLIELLVAILIVSILSVITIPSYRHLHDRFKAEKEFHRLYDALVLAKNSAIMHHHDVTILPLNYQHGWSNGCMIIEGKKILYQTKNDSHFSTISWKNLQGKSSLTFTAMGFTNTQNGTFQYYTIDHRFKKAIIINLAGRIRVGALF